LANASILDSVRNKPTLGKVGTAPRSEPCYRPSSQQGTFMGGSEFDDIPAPALAGLFYVEVDHSCVAKCAVQDPPLSPEKIFCLAMIMGETGDSGHNPRSDHMLF